MAKLYLVGTHHLDLKGPERLEKFLGFVRPDTIGLESTVENFERRIKDHEQLRGQKLFLKLALGEKYGPKAAENVIKYFDMLGYELWVPSKFSVNNGRVTLTHCDEYQKEDMGAMSQEVFGDRINDAQEITMDYIEEIAKSDFAELQRTIDEAYQNSSIRELQKDPAVFKALHPDRDERAEQKIREAVSQADHTLVYIGGAAHFFGDYDNLHDRLKDLNPVRLKLSEVDNF
ncbi:MAG: hypothetical protein WCI72_02225 [archaeon]